MTRPGSLLVVDDNEANRDVASLRLRNRGYAVTPAASAAEALALLEQQDFDLVLLDVEMTGMSGFDLLTQIRLTHTPAELPVIVATSRTRGEDIVQAFQMGANDYVSKPIDFPVAVARIGTQLAHKWAVEDLRDSEERYALAVRDAATRNADATVTRIAGAVRDGTESRLADPLTGLPSRMLFLDIVDRAIKHATRRPEYTFALLVLRLDRFRVVYDGIGPLAADQLLIAVSRRLQSGLRATDVVTHDGTRFTLARNGGDEFNVLLDVIADVSDAVRVAERLRRALEEPFEVEGNRVFLSATMGIAISGRGYGAAEEIVRDATIALNRASATGAMSFEIFDPAMRQRARSRLQVETDLRQAIDQCAFEMHYQPIVSMRTGRIAGFESLVRWRHPVRGMLSPTEFIPIAEDTGLILELGRFTIAESCRQMAAWISDFGGAAPRAISANLSSREFTNTNLLSQIASSLERTGLAASSLKLEITESAFINDVSAAKGTLEAARSMGIEWSLDDFGTGYSSLSYLHGLEVNTLKIDRSFVGRIGAAGAGLEMIKAIVGLAHTLGMDVVAEGVETEAQYAELQALGCEYAQGFFLSPPVDAAAASRLIASQPWETGRHLASA